MNNNEIYNFFKNFEAEVKLAFENQNNVIAKLESQINDHNLKLEYLDQRLEKIDISVAEIYLFSKKIKEVHNSLNNIFQPIL